MKIILFGSSGQIGSSIKKIFLNSSHHIIAYDSNNLDFEKKVNFIEIFKKEKPDLLINASGYTFVDLAESNQKKNNKINYESIKKIAIDSNECSIPLIHFSSDYVFDGRANKPYLETDTPNPLSVYGKSKYEADKVIQQNNKNHLIFRVSWVISNSNNNFFSKIIHKLKKNENLYVVDDQIGKITSNDFIASTIQSFVREISNNNFKEWGIYNLSCSGQLSWFDLANYIHKLFLNKFPKCSSKIYSLTTKDLNSPALRPYYSVLDTNKVEKITGITPPFWKLEVDKIFKNLIY